MSSLLWPRDEYARERLKITLSRQWEGTIAMIDVTGSLVEELKVYSIGDIQFLKHMLHELNWLSEQNRHVMETLEAFLAIYVNHSAGLIMKGMLKRILDDINTLKRASREAALDTVTKSSNLTNSQSFLETHIYGLYLSLHSLRPLLKELCSIVHLAPLTM